MQMLSSFGELSLPFRNADGGVEMLTAETSGKATRSPQCRVTKQGNVMSLGDRFYLI